MTKDCRQAKYMQEHISSPGIYTSPILDVFMSETVAHS